MVGSEALPLLFLRYLDWTTVFTTAACNLRFERFGPASALSVTARLARRTKSLPSFGQECRSFREGCPHSPNAFSSRAWMVRGLSRKVGSAAVGVRTAKEEMMLFLGSGGALMARQWKRTRSWSTLMRLAFGRQLQVYQALAQTALQRHVRGLLRLCRIGGFVLFIDKDFLQPTSTASCFWPSVPRDYRVRRQQEFGYWLHRQDALSVCGGPRLVPGGVARPQRTIARKDS